MRYQDRDSRLRDILESYGCASIDFIGLQSAIEELMDEDRADAYEDGAAGERESNWEFRG